MAKVLFYTANKQVLIRNMQKLWRQPSKRFNYQNTMIAMINGNPASAISCLPYSELQQQTFTTVWQIAKIQKVAVENTTAQRLYTQQGYEVIGQSGVNHAKVYKMRKMIK